MKGLLFCVLSCLLSYRTFVSTSSVQNIDFEWSCLDYEWDSTIVCAPPLSKVAQINLKNTTLDTLVLGLNNERFFYRNKFLTATFEIHRGSDTLLLLPTSYNFKALKEVMIIPPNEQIWFPLEIDQIKSPKTAITSNINEAYCKLLDSILMEGTLYYIPPNYSNMAPKHRHISATKVTANQSKCGYSNYKHHTAEKVDYEGF